MFSGISLLWLRVFQKLWNAPLQKLGNVCEASDFGVVIFCCSAELWDMGVRKENPSTPLRADSSSLKTLMTVVFIYELNWASFAKEVIIYWSFCPLQCQHTVHEKKKNFSSVWTVIFKTHRSSLGKLEQTGQLRLDVLWPDRHACVLKSHRTSTYVCLPSGVRAWQTKRHIHKRLE